MILIFTIINQILCGIKILIKGPLHHQLGSLNTFFYVYFIFHHRYRAYVWIVLHSTQNYEILFYDISHCIGTGH